MCPYLVALSWKTVGVGGPFGVIVSYIVDFDVLIAICVPRMKPYGESGPLGTGCRYVRVRQLSQEALPTKKSVKGTGPLEED